MTTTALAVAWLLGIAAAAFTGAGPISSLAAAGLLAASSFAIRPRLGTLVMLAVAIPLVLAAGWRYDTAVPVQPPDAISRLNGVPDLRFRAMIDEAPENRLTSRLYRLEVREAFVEARWRRSSGRVLMRSPPSTRFGYGDFLEIAGHLEAPPKIAEFDYPDYLARQGIRSIIAYPDTRLLATGQGSDVKAALIDFRDDLAGGLDRSLSEPESSLAAGILFGARSSLPRDLKIDMDSTGTSHLVAVSGQNITMLSGLVIAALAWLVGRRPASWIALGAILAYAALVGTDPSVVRATIMGAIYITSIALGRQNTGWVALSVAAAVMTGLDPQIVHDVSFQLSFAAVLGLAVLAWPLGERLEAALRRSEALASFPLLKPTLDMTAMSLASIIFTLPITAVNFHQISLAAPLANFLVAPAFVAVAASSTLVALASLVSPALADLLALGAWPAAAYMVWSVQLLADIPGASVQISGIGTGHAIAWYAGLGGAIFWLARRRLIEPPPPQQTSPAIGLRLAVPAIGAVLLLSSAVVWLAADSGNERRLSVTFLDVGQGEAILVESPSGNRVLIDGGPSGDAITGALGRQLPFYDRRIDLVVATHQQTDHIGGLPEVLERYAVSAVLQTQVTAGSLAYDAWRDAVTASGPALIEAVRGQEIDLGSGARITVLGPQRVNSDSDGDANDSSMVLLVSYGSVRILLTGDVSEDAEAALVAAGTDLRADVLKVAHHGSATSTSTEFLRRVRPWVAVISAGHDNQFGHPDPETLAKLRLATVYRTDEDGDVEVLTDGQNLWVETSR